MTGDVFVSVVKVVLAHEMKTTSEVLCDYSEGRKFFGVSYAVSGNAEYRLSSGESFKVCAGDVVFLTDKARYTVLTGGDYHHYTVNFLLSEAPTSDLLHPSGVSVLFGGGGIYHGLFSAISELWRDKKFGYEMRSISVLYSVLSEFFHGLYLKNTDDFAHRRLAPAKEYIDTHPTEDISIEFLSELVSMSRTNFRREFARLFGDSPIHYRDTRRIAFIKDALATGFYTVSEAARTCGFEDTSYFSRFFKKHTGMTPMEFKKNC
ncbi:MAG: helix-turn-helix transcriptional regulator [Clostridia bacterium]|nr:helix-turn-helix transcriptional regulator [Clostridia bacterium]